MNGKTSVAEFDGPAVIISSIGARCGKCFLANGKFTTLANVQVVFPDVDKLHPSFLWNLVNDERFWQRYATAQPFIRPSDIRESWIPVPPLDEQTAIARILDTVDAASERARTAVRQAQKLRRGLLDDLLSCGLSDDGSSRRAGSHEFVSTALGRLPASWRLSSIDREFDLQNGFTLNSARRARFKRRRYLRVANVQRDALNLSDVQELEADDDEFAPRILAEGDLLIVEGHADRLQIGRCARVTPEASGMTFQNHLFRLRTKGAVLSAFACLWLNSSYARRYWNARCATSSGLNTINQRMLKRLAIPVTSQAEQQAIVELADTQRRHIASLISKQSQLEQLKKSLMHDLLTGRVRVREEPKVAAA